MGTERPSHDVMTLHDYVRVVRRRKWVIAAVAVLLPVLAVLYSLHQQKLYKASAQVYLSRQSIVQILNGGANDPTLLESPDRVAATQAGIAENPIVAQRTLQAVKVTTMTPEQFLHHSTVVAQTDADLLNFQVTNHDPKLAELMATSYARQYTIYRRQLDTAAIEKARLGLEQRLAALPGSKRGSHLYDVLVTKDQSLRTIEALQTGNATLARSADNATQVQPKPVRNGILGFGVGLLLGIVLAFLWEALDTRVRSTEEISERLHLPLLARLPEPPKNVRAENRLVMLNDPGSVQAEAFRMLRTNLEFVNLERGAQTVMVTSAVAGEGKSTTVANLGVALARAGRRVVLVDLDLRRPFLRKFFPLNGHPGVTDVALGHARLDEALVQVAITRTGDGATASRTETNGHAQVEGVLEVLGSGPPPPDTGEFVGTHALSAVLDQLRERADIVLIDAPPLLQVGDALTLSARVDAMLVVTRLKLLRRPLLRELHRLLEACRAEKLGFILTGAEAEDGYGYGYGYGYGTMDWRTEKREAEVA